MSKLSRTKGVEFEQRIARDLRGVLPRATVHRSSQADRAYAPDVVIDGDVPPLVRRLWLECQDSRQPSPLDKLAQAERDTAHHSVATPLPIVVWHKTGSRTVNVTLRNGEWLHLLFNAAPQIAVGGTCGEIGIPITLDWDHFLDVLKALDAQKGEQHG